jgi:hypothetical protein
LVILAVTFVITHLGSPERPCSSAWSVRGGQDPVELTFKCKNHCKEQGKDCPGASSCKLSGTGICRMTVRVPSQICATGQILRTCISVETENPCALTLENPCDEEFIVCHQQVAVCGQVFECEG